MKTEVYQQNEDHPIYTSTQGTYNNIYACSANYSWSSDTVQALKARVAELGREGRQYVDEIFQDTTEWIHPHSENLYIIEEEDESLGRKTSR